MLGVTGYAQFVQTTGMDSDMNRRTRVVTLLPPIVWGSLCAGAVWAQTPPSPPPSAAETPAAEPAKAPEPAAPAGPTPIPMIPGAVAGPSPMSNPAMSGPLSPNQKPLGFDLGALGTVYTTGVVSGLAQWQNNASPGDQASQADVSNAQIFLNKTDGLVQFFLQAGAYSLPDIGVPYDRASHATNDFYGPLPQWFVKLAPTDEFSIMVGKLPTLIGSEYTFSFENMNIERGLLWNQENAVNRGVQVNYSAGPLALAFSWNDGFYSNKYTWASLSATYTIDKENTVAIIAGGNTKKETVSTTATPLFQNNEQIYNLVYTHAAGPWTIQPYVQYTRVPASAEYDTTESASTTGVALLVNYAFDADSSFGGLKLAGVNLPVRVEYISSTGSVAGGAPNLMYGPGSKAWSITVTPTYQEKIFFARAELSFVQARSTTPGLAFGADGNHTSQTRFLLEAGILF